MHVHFLRAGVTSYFPNVLYFQKYLALQSRPARMAGQSRVMDDHPSGIPILEIRGRPLSSR